MSPQLKRPLILLCSIIVLFLIARHLVKPEGYGVKGYYRIESLEENQAYEVNYKGSESCNDCHDDIVTLRDSSEHKTLQCEACHGPGYKHVESGEAKDIVIPEGREFCAWCHSKNFARSQNNVKQVDIKEHNIENNCVECHNPHAPWN